MFAGELPGEFDDIVAALGAPRRRAASPLGGALLRLLGAVQGVLGALPDATKRRLEERIGDRRFFGAELATAGNVFLNLVLYPIACMVIGVARIDLAGGGGLVFDWGGLFAWDIRWWVALGLLLGFGEALWRLRESVFGGRPIGEGRLRGAAYGVVLLPVASAIEAFAGRRGAASGVGFDGYYAGDEHFDEKAERARRYGEIYKLEERDNAYVLRLEFPRMVPPTSLGSELGLPREMPDYEYDLAVRGTQFVVHGRLTDPQVRKITGVAPAFPPDFTTRIALDSPVAGFRHRLRGKTLEVVLPKASVS
jgi:hypothetical protein